jgi:hypothetical protein
LVLADDDQALAAEPEFHRDPPQGGGTKGSPFADFPIMAPNRWSSNRKMVWRSRWIQRRHWASSARLTQAASTSNAADNVRLS